jgi:hypothetical protein
MKSVNRHNKMKTTQQPTGFRGFYYSLDGLRIELVGSNSFKDQWGMVLKEAGVKVVERLFTDAGAI